jgi:hypothetical protein
MELHKEVNHPLVGLGQVCRRHLRSPSVGGLLM